MVATLEKDTCKTREESLLEIYRKLRPGEPPTRGFRRVPHQQPVLRSPAAMTCPPWAAISSTRSCPSGPVCPARSWLPPWPTPAPARSSPRPGELLNRDQAQELDDRGVSEACRGRGRHRRQGLLQQAWWICATSWTLTPRSAASARRSASQVLCELLDQYAGDEEGLKDAIVERKDDLIPKHIIVDDIMASINYL